MPLNTALSEFNLKGYTSFHMPGHREIAASKKHNKYQKFLLKDLRKFQSKFYSYDLTETENLDNLQEPSGCIKSSQDLLAEFFNASKAFYLTNGSTLGVMAMINGFLKKGEKLLLIKHSHKSAYQALKVGSIKPVYVRERSCDNGSFKMELDDLEKKAETVGAKAVFITSPDYYGCDENIAEISKIAKEHGLYLLVDSAHGAHYRYMGKKTPLELGADCMNLSYHKTLPALNQSALLLAGNGLSSEVTVSLQNWLNTLQTSSPSYPIIANIELVHFLMKLYGRGLYRNLIKLCEQTRTAIDAMPDIQVYDSDDETRLVIKSENFSGIELSYVLEHEYKILAEMADQKSVIFIFNPLTTKTDINKLINALKNISFKTSKSLPEISNENYEALLDSLKENFGKPLEKNIYIYPPGTAAFVKGEKISQKLISTIESAQDLKILLQ